MSIEDKNKLEKIIEQSIFVVYKKKNKKDIEKNFCKFVYFDEEKKKLSDKDISETVLETINNKIYSNPIQPEKANKVLKIKKKKIKYYEVEYE